MPCEWIQASRATTSQPALKEAQASEGRVWLASLIDLSYLANPNLTKAILH